MWSSSYNQVSIEAWHVFNNSTLTHSLSLEPAMIDVLSVSYFELLSACVQDQTHALCMGINARCDVTLTYSLGA